VSSKFFLFAPASLYPHPEARLIDEDGDTIHTWSCDEEQPPLEDDPPSFLRGWNHVELDHLGNLFAVVPLQAILKLDAGSNLAWKCLIPAHHDIAVAPDGDLYVLCEEPAFVAVAGQRYLILDHLITVLHPDGWIKESTSLFQVLASERDIQVRMEEELCRRYRSFSPTGWPVEGVDANSVPFAETRSRLSARATGDARRRTLQRLRQLPGSPCDILHPNTLELLDGHPDGLWEKGHVLLSLRALDLVVVVDLRAQKVIWHWGPGEISGQHQPSALPNGNILIFDNGVSATRSRLVEVNPISRAIVWEYVACPPESFFCEVAGGCELGPEGNILVTDAQSARIFELTRDKQIVWQHVVSDVPTATNAHRTTLYRAVSVDGTVVARLLG
jgi:hypothetical protein